MIHFLLILLGFAHPNNNLNTINNNQITVQSSTDLDENFDTGGETGQIIPPRK
ncbi:uncharacterized protein CHSO_0641 [Chryseobacterium sp. StRB126]|uniref:hypothetical protein n=1 Tax=Chryseobacterium sp. StRB126 TaxID=878220 RepID=UPI0004E9835C|nr:hypothetical protein [Chryseobacterium sp. StRB126]BAP29678.1 uncharacterized protein CHSO_0641 [Chryseobacterium sp. StRB126]